MAQAEWLNERRLKIVEHLLTLGPILGIALAFITPATQRAILAEDLVAFVAGALGAYTLLTFELQVGRRSGWYLYLVTSLSMAYGFGGLMSLAISFYGGEVPQNLGFLATVLMVEDALLARFRAPHAVG
jgi:hypothetical protein